MSSRILEPVAEVQPDRLKEYVRALEGLRHGTENYSALEETACFIEEELRSHGLNVESQPLIYRGRRYRNIIAAIGGSEPDKGRLLVGAHYDSPRTSPGADDNASGVAAMLETARILGGRRFGKTVEFVAFTLEEAQVWNHSILRGSRRFVREARGSGTRYDAVLILECVGYTDQRQRSQTIPSLVGIPVPETGDFLGVIADKRSRALMEAFNRSAVTCAPSLEVISYAVPLHGWLIPQSRYSDHASFWNRGYPALMLTDTAMFRNPHYHTPHDTSDTLDFDFLADVARCVTGFVWTFGGLRPEHEGEKAGRDVNNI